MYLDATTRSLRMYTDATATTTEPVFYASFVNIADQSFLPEANHGALNGTTPVEIVGAPATGFSRQVKQLTVHNGDSVSHDLSVELYDNSTQRLVYVLSIGAGQSAFWTHEYGWQVV